MPNHMLKEMREKMKQAVQSFSKNIATVRAGRANPNILDNIFVDYYGASTPLNQIANVSAPEARLVMINPYDKTAITAIEKAIQIADLGLTPSNDGAVVRLSIPPLTEERRKDLVKVVSKYTEESRIQVRNIRRDINDQLKKAEKDNEVTEDELRTLQDQVQKETDGFIEELEQLAKNKEVDILEV